MLTGIAAAATSVSAGELGSTSRSSIGIAVTIPTRLEAKVLAPDEMSPTLLGRRSQALCIVTNSHGATYSVTLVSASDATASALAQRSVDLATVSVDSRNQSGGFQSAKLRPAEPLRGLPAVDAEDCKPGANGIAQLMVKANEPATAALNPLREPVTLLIAPE